MRVGLLCGTASKAQVAGIRDVNYRVAITEALPTTVSKLCIRSCRITGSKNDITNVINIDDIYGINIC